MIRAVQLLVFNPNSLIFQAVLQDFRYLVHHTKRGPSVAVLRFFGGLAATTAKDHYIVRADESIQAQQVAVGLRGRKRHRIPFGPEQSGIAGRKCPAFCPNFLQRREDNLKVRPVLVTGDETGNESVSFTIFFIFKPHGVEIHLRHLAVFFDVNDQLTLKVKSKIDYFSAFASATKKITVPTRQAGYWKGRRSYALF